MNGGVKMYRRLKNVLGVSLMALAIVISQIPMPEAQAEETNTVTFSMNGGSFSGEYNGYNFEGQTPVLVLDDNQPINKYPDEKYAFYSGYETESGKWYTDKQCLEEYDKKNIVTDSVTIYKKWYSSENGFYLNPDKTVLYKYAGDSKLVRIPDTVTTIAPNAFDKLENVRGIVLPENIERVCDNAFSGADNENSIIYLYDSSSLQSRQIAQSISENSEQLVYSSYLNVEKVEEIAGINYTESENNLQAEAETRTETQTETETETQAEAETQAETEVRKEYTVTFDTGISEIAGEKRTVPSGSTISELVSIADEQPKLLKRGSFSLNTDNGTQETVYIFDGWYKNVSCTLEWDFANDTIESDTTVYAKWNREIKNYYYVTFVAEGAENVPEKLKLFAGEFLNEPSQIPSVKGKRFLGWYTDEENEETEYTEWGKTISKNLTLYAQWEKDGYTVTFDMNGGKYSGTFDGKEYNNVTSVKIKAEKGNGIEKTDYPEYESDAVFKYAGYNTDSDWYTDKSCLLKYSKTNSNGDVKEVKKNITLYKKWYATTSGFTMNVKKTVLYKYSGSAGDVVIPSTVTTIADDAFTNVSAVTSVALPDNLTSIESDAFSGFSSASKNVKITAKSESAIKIAKELASKYKYLVYEENVENTNNSDKSKTTESTSVSVVNTKDSGSITLGASISGNAGTNTSQAAGSNEKDAAESTGITLGVTNGAATTNLGANAVTVGETPTEEVRSLKVSAVSDTDAEQKPVSGNGSNTTVTKEKTVTKINASSASAPTGAQHVRDSTPKTGDPTQYRMLLVCALFSVGMLLLLTGNGRGRKALPF